MSQFSSFSNLFRENLIVTETVLHTCTAYHYFCRPSFVLLNFRSNTLLFCLKVGSQALAFKIRSTCEGKIVHIISQIRTIFNFNFKQLY